ncbi:MAG: hypothetical protein GX117_09450 [Candidatus Hydrogenedentes bacterium]|nr:hypothetical protein [Candidatus Hydrogenedentota bacterium]
MFLAILFFMAMGRDVSGSRWAAMDGMDTMDTMDGMDGMDGMDTMDTMDGMDTMDVRVCGGTSKLHL